MGDPGQVLDFQFVNSTLATPGGPKDNANRALIRKQAMKRVAAARRKEGNYGKHNLRQFPIFVVDGNNGNGASSVARKGPAELNQGGKATRSTRGNGKQMQNTSRAQGDVEKKDANHSPEVNSNSEQMIALVQTRSIPASLPAKGYELMSMNTDFNILDLSTLATLHIGRTVRGALSQDPHHLIHQLRAYKRWSYLSFLPSRYSQVTCLSDATNCVIARARQIIFPGNNWEAAVITFYLRALNSLQKALDSPKQRYEPEVLCATEILAMYELLDPSGETAWVRHTAGASKLIHVRGPKCYNTEFEKALFIAHTVPTMTECLLNGEHCYLEQPAWQKTFKSVIEPASLISDRSESVVTLLMAKCNIPGFCADATALLFSPIPPTTPEVARLASRIHDLRKRFKDWHERYTEVVKQLTEMGMKPGSRDYDSHCKALANFYSCLIISGRCLAAVDGKERRRLEAEIQELVDKMIELDREVRVCSPPTSLFMAQTLAVSKAARATSEDWLGEGGGDASDGSGLIDKGKWERWCRGFGRRMPWDEK